MKVRGGDEGNGDLLALEVLRLLDAGAVARDQRFRLADIVEDPEELGVDAARHRGGGAGRSDDADGDIAGGQRHRYVASRGELAPVDLESVGGERLVEAAIGDGA